MLRTSFALLALAAIPVAFPAPAHAGKPEPVNCVPLAKTWEAAVEEAKLLNVPIVVHSHGFYCGPCWGMHSAVMCNKKYIEFAKENTVEVIALQRLDEGVEQKEKKAETYEAKVDGKTVEYLCEFPGMTVEDMLGLLKGKANTFNKTGKIPYTCLVNPWTEEEVKGWASSTSTGAIQEAVLELRKELTKEHGKGVSRKDLGAIADAEREAKARAEKGDFAGGLERLARLDARASKWSEPLKVKLADAKTGIIEAASAALAAIEEKKETDAAAAKKELAAIAGKLKGTGLEEKAKTLLGSL